MIGQMATAITTFLFNIILMRLAGSDGVAAMTILFYGQFLFNAFYLGFAIGIAPGRRLPVWSRKPEGATENIPDFLLIYSYLFDSNDGSLHYTGYADRIRVHEGTGDIYSGRRRI